MYLVLDFMDEETELMQEPLDAILIVQPPVHQFVCLATDECRRSYSRKNNLKQHI